MLLSYHEALGNRKGPEIGRRRGRRGVESARFVRWTQDDQARRSPEIGENIYPARTARPRTEATGLEADGALGARRHSPATEDFA